MIDRELLQMALDALDEARDAIAGWGSYASPYFQEKHNLEGDIDDCDAVIEALRAALAQPEPEELGEIVPADKEQLKRIAKLVEPEPVAWMHDSHVGFNVPLYTAPPQREWKGLTDDDFIGLTTQQIFAMKFAEAKLKEKNG